MVCTFAKPKKNIAFYSAYANQFSVWRQKSVNSHGKTNSAKRWIDCRGTGSVMMSLKANLANFRPHNLKYLLLLVIISAFVCLQRSRNGVQKVIQLKQPSDASTSDNFVPFENTTCGRRAYERGSGQNVIAFSFYGDPNSEHSKTKGYFIGIKENLDLITQV